MAGISIPYANHVLDAILGSGGVTLGSGFVVPANVYLALCTVAPTNTMTGSTITEPSSVQYSGYARAAIANNPTNFPNASGAAKANGAPINFSTSAGGTSSPVTVNWFALCDALTGGALITFAQLNTPLVVSTGITPSFPVGTLSFGEV